MIFCVDKPVGITSNQAVQIVKRGGGFKKVGHAGTLDPAATGLLVIGTDESTKLLAGLLLEDKEYVATIRFGVHTDTYDATGFVVRYSENYPDHKAVVAALSTFPMEYQQVPPAYSALKVKGKRAYDLARNGETVELVARTAQILDKELIEYVNGALKVRIVVKKGFYVRSFAVDLAASMHTDGVLTELQRTRSGSYTLAQARPLSEFGYKPVQDRSGLHRESKEAKDLLGAGQVELANNLVRRDYSLEGVVIPGIKKARLLGYPTANIAHKKDHCLAADGVYKSHTSYDGLLFRSLTFIGVGHDEGAQGHKFESHLFHFSGDLYGRTIKTSLVKFIRTNQRFESLERLIAQIKDDVGRALGD